MVELWRVKTRMPSDLVTLRRMRCIWQSWVKSLMGRRGGDTLAAQDQESGKRLAGLYFRAQVQRFRPLGPRDPPVLACRLFKDSRLDHWFPLLTTSTLPIDRLRQDLARMQQKLAADAHFTL